MPAHSASAPGKAILFGEHAVVYGQPAIAIPIFQVQAKAIIKADIQAPEGRIWISSELVGLDSDLEALESSNPLKLTIKNTLKHYGIERAPAFRLKIDSSVPVAAGLGSGAAVSAAIARAVAGFLGQEISDGEVSEITHESEKVYHGTPSGVDSTVVSFKQAVYFEKGRPLEFVEIARPFSLLIGDTGVRSNTREVVDDVRKAWKQNPESFEGLFKAVGEISLHGRKALRLGNVEHTGKLMKENHALLVRMDVSSPELDNLVQAANQAGALGAKLSGGGRGGNMLALAAEGTENRIAKALTEAGAVSVINTRVE